jgi:hypothetical protein
MLRVMYSKLLQIRVVDVQWIELDQERRVYIAGEES